MAVRRLSALRAGDRSQADLLVIDLPASRRGLRTFLAALRAREYRFPVLALTRDSRHRWPALRAGADDVVLVPLDASEVEARATALVRRYSAITRRTSTLRFADLSVDLQTRVITRAGVEVKATASQSLVLQLLMRGNGKVLSRDTLLRSLRRERSADLQDSTIDSHVASLRRVLGDDPFRPRYIETRRGAGYRLAVPAGSRRA